jgi:hypothetical protein
VQHLVALPAASKPRHGWACPGFRSVPAGRCWRPRAPTAPSDGGSPAWDPSPGTGGSSCRAG